MNKKTNDLNNKANNDFESKDTPIFQEQFDNEELIQEQNPQPVSDNTKKRKGFFDNLLLRVGIVLSVISIATMLMGESHRVDDSYAASQAINDGISTSLSAGTILMSDDEATKAKDYTISHDSSSQETNIWVWDYAAEDGDYVQILVDGVPFTEAFMIKNKPQVFKVPSTGIIQIKGVRDGGGGITYAIRYELNNTTYFNSAPEGDFNTYTLVRN